MEINKIFLLIIVFLLAGCSCQNTYEDIYGTSSQEIITSSRGSPFIQHITGNSGNNAIFDIITTTIIITTTSTSTTTTTTSTSTSTTTTTMLLPDCSIMSYETCSNLYCNCPYMPTWDFNGYGWECVC